MKYSLLSSAIAVGSVIGLSTPAQAATDGWVYVVVNNNVCGTSGAQVRGILLSDTQSGWSSSSWDNGDNIIYPRVRLNTTNNVNAQVRCDKKSGIVWQPVGYRTVSGTFVPRSTGQTFWIG